MLFSLAYLTSWLFKHLFFFSPFFCKIVSSSREKSILFPLYSLVSKADLWLKLFSLCKCNRFIHRLNRCCVESLLTMIPRSGEIPAVAHSGSEQEWKGWRERIARLWEFPSLGFNHLDLAVEPMDWTLTRACAVGLTAEDLLCPVDLSAHEGWQSRAARGQHKTITGAHAWQGISSGLYMYGATIFKLQRKDIDSRIHTAHCSSKLLLQCFLPPRRRLCFYCLSVRRITQNRQNWLPWNVVKVGHETSKNSFNSEAEKEFFHFLWEEMVLVRIMRSLRILEAFFKICFNFSKSGYKKNRIVLSN